ncbi:hypothetical protein ACN2XU_22630 [Primorskyibacter sp. 2E107]|uniref:hypothetical protein n=1 Tax=Primorskyibacter sp. 2E107 TaxID=3403458 RepID=UPI003AF63DA0
MTDKFSDIISVSSILQERALDKHRQNLATSKRLQDELTQIDTLRQAIQADGASLGARQLSGADTLWQTWLVTKRARLLQEMAMARALEADSLARARTAQARYDAANALEKEEKKRIRDRRILAQTEALEDMGRLRQALSDNL